MMHAYGETMTREQPGLYLGDDVRAERNASGQWALDMKCNPLDQRFDWHEFSPHGSWTPVGSWPTLDRGMQVASLLRAGTHFYDGARASCRRYDETVYAVLRGESIDPA